jgi:aminoglycoside phosphotransferase (APT) family kinase protein
VRLHPDQLDLQPDDVRRLLRAQRPDLADLPIARVPSGGTVNAMFRVGTELVARLPFTPSGVPDVEREALVLPRLADALPVPVPRLVEVGAPDAGYPSPWLLLRWLPGRVVAPGELTPAAAAELARAVVALRAVDPRDAPVGYRAGDVRALDAQVRRSLAEVADEVDMGAALAVWDDACAAEPHGGAPVWAHGDLLPGNVLVDEAGALCGVLDLGTAGVGDPACDGMAAWSLMGAAARGTFRDILGADDAAWRRGRGWALAQAVIALPYYRHTNPAMTATARRVVSELGVGPDPSAIG